MKYNTYNSIIARNLGWKLWKIRSRLFRSKMQKFKKVRMMIKQRKNHVLVKFKLLSKARIKLFIFVFPCKSINFQTYGSHLYRSIDSHRFIRQIQRHRNLNKSTQLYVSHHLPYSSNINTLQTNMLDCILCY